LQRDLAAHGFIVLVGSRNLERGEAASREVETDARALQLDVLIQNAAISNTNKQPGQSVEEYAKTTRPSNMSLDEMRAVWDTKVFGVLAVYQAMLPLLRETPGARIVNVSSGAGSLTRNSDPAFTLRSIFGPVYPASKTAPNALTVAMAIELEQEGIKVNAVSPALQGRTSTDMRARRLSRRAPARRCASRCWARTAPQGRSRAGKTKVCRSTQEGGSV
jgi:NAD(P)-dependent dehydrogenase (short-subunit alcohol dehydrogenase family)